MTFIENDWFTDCSEICYKLRSLVIFPLIEFIGIDKAHETKSADKSGNGVKVFFEHKMQVLKDLKEAKLKGNCTGLEKLEATVIKGVIETAQRQLS